MRITEAGRRIHADVLQRLDHARLALLVGKQRPGGVAAFLEAHLGYCCRETRSGHQNEISRAMPGSFGAVRTSIDRETGSEPMPHLAIIQHR
jgi:hypothetical protein